MANHLPALIQDGHLYLQLLEIPAPVLWIGREQYRTLPPDGRLVLARYNRMAAAAHVRFRAAGVPGRERSTTGVWKAKSDR